MTFETRWLDTAIEAARKAGEIQLGSFGRGVEIHKKGTIDLVTEVDFAVERMIRSLLAERFPDHGVLAEELQEGAAEARPEHCWIIDPVDGTTNYAHGLPFFCVSIALEIGGRPELGVVFDPCRDELFTATRGGGAHLNGRPIRVSSARDLVDALLCTGFPYDVHATLDEVIGLFRDFVGQARAVRRLGSAALDLSYVAAGRLDGFWEQRLHAWDVAAGALIVTEAGGVVTDWQARPYRSTEHAILAATPGLHGQMLAIIEQFFASRRAL